MYFYLMYHLCPQLWRNTRVWHDWMCEILISRNIKDGITKQMRGNWIRLQWEAQTLAFLEFWLINLVNMLCPLAVAFSFMEYKKNLSVKKYCSWMRAWAHEDNSSVFTIILLILWLIVITFPANDSSFLWVDGDVRLEEHKSGQGFWCYVI